MESNKLEKLNFSLVKVRYSKSYKYAVKDRIVNGEGEMQQYRKREREPQKKKDSRK